MNRFELNNGIVLDAKNMRNGTVIAICAFFEEI